MKALAQDQPILLRFGREPAFVQMIELERGGFGLIPNNALDGAQAILAKKHISEALDTLKRLEKTNDQGKAFAKFRDEIAQDEDGDLEEA